MTNTPIYGDITDGVSDTRQISQIDIDGLQQTDTPNKLEISAAYSKH